MQLQTEPIDTGTQTSLRAAKAARKPTMVDLPVDLLDQVLDRVDPEELFRCRAVNKVWQQTVDDSPNRWQRQASALCLPSTGSRTELRAAVAYSLTSTKHLTPIPIPLFRQGSTVKEQRRLR